MGPVRNKMTSERIERKISAATSISMCALTVLAQIATTLLLTHFLQEKASYVYGLLELAGALTAIRVYQRAGPAISWPGCAC